MSTFIANIVIIIVVFNITVVTFIILLLFCYIIINIIIIIIAIRNRGRIIAKNIARNIGTVFTTIIIIYLCSW